MIERLEVRAQATVHAQNLFIDERGGRQRVKAVRKCLPQAHGESPLALIVKPVNPIDGGALVIPAQQEEVLRIPNLVREEEANCLKRLSAPIDVIPQE